MDKPRPRKKGPKKLKAKPKKGGPKPAARPAPPAQSDDPAYAVPYDPARVEAFVLGQITLGDLEGITKKQQYEMAEVGYAYLTGGKLEEAKTVFEGLVALDEYDAYFLASLGSIAQQTGDLDEADRRYTRALEINPFSPFARAHRGEIRINLGRLEEGVEDLIRSVEVDPEGRDPASIRARATLAILVKQLEDAGLDAKALKSRAQAPIAAPAGVAPEAVRPKVKQIDPALLEKFAEESELVVTRRRRTPDPPHRAPEPKPEREPEPEPESEAQDPEETVTIPKANAPQPSPRRKPKPRKKP